MSVNDRLWTTSIILKDHGPDVDLTSNYVVIEFEDGAPQSAVITLNAARGRFLTTGTIIEKWDRIWVNVKDQNGVVAINAVVHVTSMEKMRPKGKGLQLKLNCAHQSSNIIKQTIAKPNRRSSGNEAMVDLVNQINANLATNDPSVEIVTPFDVTNKNGIRLDEGTSNDYIFDAVKAEIAAQEIVRREGNPVEGGGSFEFMFFRFISKYDGLNEADLDTVYIQVFEQGFMTSDGNDFTNVAQFTLTKELLATTDKRSNTLQFDSELETERGTNLIAIGDRFSGSYPTDYSIFMGEKEFFESAKPWITGRVYLKGVLVTSDETTFEATVDHVSTVPPPNAFWIARVFDPALNFEWSTGVTFQVDQITTHNRIGYKALQQALSSTANEPPNDEFWRRISWAPTVEYSPLKKDKVQYRINALGEAKHAATDNRRTAIITPDVVVKDDNHPRTWVDTIQISDLNIPSELLVNGDTPMDTLRNLCMDVATGLPAGADAFSGNDRNGVPFAGNIAEYVSADGPGNGEWVVAGLGVGNTTVLVDDQEIYDYYDGLSWVRGPEGNTTGLWLKGAYFMIGNQTSLKYPLTE